MNNKNFEYFDSDGSLHEQTDDFLLIKVRYGIYQIHNNFKTTNEIYVRHREDLLYILSKWNTEKSDYIYYPILDNYLINKPTKLTSDQVRQLARYYLDDAAGQHYFNQAMQELGFQNIMGWTIFDTPRIWAKENLAKHKIYKINESI